MPHVYKDSIVPDSPTMGVKHYGKERFKAVITFRNGMVFTGPARYNRSTAIQDLAKIQDQLPGRIYL